MTKDDASDGALTVVFSGEHAFLSLSALNTFEPDSITVGQVLCRGGEVCVSLTMLFSPGDVGMIPFFRIALLFEIL